MFKMKFDSKLLRDYLTVIGVIVDEATFKIEPEGIKLRAMDPSRVAMIDFELMKSTAMEYTCDAPKKLCFNVSEMLKLLKRAGTYKTGTGKEAAVVNEVVELSKDTSTGKLLVILTGKYTRNFTLPTLEPSEEEVPTPKISFNVKAKFVTSQLLQAIEDAQLVSDHLRFQAEPTKLVLHAQGDLMNATIAIEPNNGTLLEYDVKEPSKSAFSLSYLRDIIAATKETAELSVMEFSTDMPLKINFQQNKEEAQLIFYLAPRIETE